MKRINYKKEEEKRQAEWYQRHIEIACERLQITVNQYKRFKKISEELNQLDTDSCNGDIDEANYEICLESATNRLGEYLTKINRPFSICWYHQTDPRGASLYLDDKPISRDRYTDAVCIY